MGKIFFSWQSDIGTSRNKFTRALNLIVRDLGKELEESQRPELDSDTKGRYGSVKILDTIFEKIDQCEVFIADVTPIAKKGQKLIPNPNVMAELGYALKAKNGDKILFIYSAEKPIDNDRMPFDIKGNSLLGFDTNKAPRKIADELLPMIKGMLGSSTQPTITRKYLNIYISSVATTKYADGTTTSLTVRNAEDSTYFLESISFNGHTKEVHRSMEPGGTIQGISLDGKLIPFDTENPQVNLVVSSNESTYRLEQGIKTSERIGDGKFNIAFYVERSKVLSEEVHLS